MEELLQNMKKHREGNSGSPIIPGAHASRFGAMQD